MPVLIKSVLVGLVNNYSGYILEINDNMMCIERELTTKEFESLCEQFKEICS